jgi:hypothetical protein
MERWRLMTVISMSRSEIDRMTVLRDLAEDRIRVSEAATLMGLGRRQVFRLAKAFRRRGPAALASRRRGNPSNRSYPSVLRTEVIGIIRERYADFGPTLAGEKLTELHGIELSRETIRQWMMAAGLWKDRGQRLKPVHQPRHRRDCVGELIQIETESTFDYFKATRAYLERYGKRVLFRQARGVSGQQEGCGGWRWDDAVWARSACA